MENRNDTRGESGKTSEFEVYLTNGMTSDQVRHILRAQKKDEKEIESFVKRLEEEKKKIKAFVVKFTDKIKTKYGNLDIADLMRKGLKFAKKHNLTESEKHAFLRFAAKGDIGAQFSEKYEKESEMANFLGVAKVVNAPIETLNAKPGDLQTLNEIQKRFNETRYLHTSIKNQLVSYRDCAPEALLGEYNKNIHNISVYIHPVIAALFLPKIDAIDKRMLYTNIGRMVLQRSQHLLKNVDMRDAYLPGELDADSQLAFDIATDPNSLAYFTDERPITNLLKRFNIQIKLWNNVLNFRQGNYYSKGDHDADDGISGFVRTLNSYDWTFFDSPEYYGVQDEGTVLRKLLAVFSLRPTLVEVRPMIPQSMNTLTPMSFNSMSNVGAFTKTVHFHMPIINVRWETDVFGQRVEDKIFMSKALTQNDSWVDVESKIPVQRSKSVIYSKDLLFFYVNRRYQTVRSQNVEARFRCVALPFQSVNVTSINKAEVEFQDSLTVASDIFKLRSVVLVVTPQSQGDIATGCSAMIVPKESAPTANYFHYNPQVANLKFNVGDKYVSNAPFTLVGDSSDSASHIGFREAARTMGSIFVYTTDSNTGSRCDGCY